MINKFIEEKSKELKEFLIKTRRYLHQYPELSEKEYGTKQYILNFLKENNIEYIEVLDTGIDAYINNGKGKKIAFRADMDALPLEEKNNLDFISKNKGIMHACGHDVHMAVQMGLIKALNESKDKWSGEAHFFFQPAEETVGGAKRMIENGVLNGIDNILAFHCAPEIKSGKIGIKYGKLHATSAVFKLEIIGKETHGALAYQGIDSIVVASKVVDYLQSIVSRRIDARDCALISVCTFNAGTAENIIASNAVLTGTIRTLTQETKKFIVDILNNELKQFVQSFGAELIVNIRDSYAPVINNDEFTEFFFNNSKDVIGIENIEIIKETRMDVEDMGYFLEKVPGTFYRLGVSKDKNYKELHTKDFFVDEKCLEIAFKVQYKTALEYLCLK